MLAENVDAKMNFIFHLIILSSIGFTILILSFTWPIECSLPVVSNQADPNAVRFSCSSHRVQVAGTAGGHLTTGRTIRLVFIRASLFSGAKQHNLNQFNEPDQNRHSTDALLYGLESRGNALPSHASSLDRSDLADSKA